MIGDALTTVALAKRAKVAKNKVIVLGGMQDMIKQWLEKRREVARLCREDAQTLLLRNPATAYYEAQRLAARARFSGDGRAFMRWASVAAEVARTSSNPMDMDVVQAIVDEERRRAGK